MSRYFIKWITEHENDRTPFQVWKSGTIIRYDKPDDPYLIMEAVIDADRGKDIKGVLGIYFSFMKILEFNKVHDNFDLSKRNFNFENRTNLYWENEDEDEKQIVDPIEKRLGAIGENT
jgi:hypothetical protein